MESLKTDYHKEQEQYRGILTLWKFEKGRMLPLLTRNRNLLQTCLYANRIGLLVFIQGGNDLTI